MNYTTFTEKLIKSCSFSLFFLKALYKLIKKKKKKPQRQTKSPNLYSGSGHNSEIWGKSSSLFQVTSFSYLMVSPTN